MRPAFTRRARSVSVVAMLALLATPAGVARAERQDPFAEVWDDFLDFFGIDKDEQQRPVTTPPPDDGAPLAPTKTYDDPPQDADPPGGWLDGYDPPECNLEDDYLYRDDCFQDGGGGGVGGPAPVPEPMTALLLGLGASTVAAERLASRRRRRRS